MEHSMEPAQDIGRRRSLDVEPCRSVDSSFEVATAEGTDAGTEHSMESSMGDLTEQSMEHLTDCSTEHSMERSIEHSIGPADRAAQLGHCRLGPQLHSMERSMENSFEEKKRWVVRQTVRWNTRRNI